MFTDCLGGTENKLKKLIWSGVSAMCWAIWLYLNEIVFDRANTLSSIQVIFRGTYWIGLWSLLQTR